MTTDMTSKQRLEEVLRVTCIDARVRQADLTGATVTRSGQAVKLTLWRGTGRAARPIGEGGVRLRTFAQAKVEVGAWQRELRRRGLLLRDREVGTPPGTGQLTKGGRG